MRHTIEKGDKFLCINDFVMEDDTIAYIKGKVYTCENDGCITDEEGTITHWLYDFPQLFEYFEKYSYPTNTRATINLDNVNSLEHVIWILKAFDIGLNWGDKMPERFEYLADNNLLIFDKD